MRAPLSPARRIALLAPWLLCSGALACGPDESVEPDDRVAVKLSFDQSTYVDAATSPHKMLERIKNQTRSVFPTLRKADVMVVGNTQVEVEPAKLKHERTTVVDPVSGVTRAVQRVRFHYVTLAQVPRALADKGDLALGELHSRDGARAEAILAACTANGESERLAVAELWTVFDPALPTCAEAMRLEQADIDAARKKLAHPEREIVPAEFDRVYLPMVVHIKRRQPADAGGAPVAQTPAGPFVPSPSPVGAGAGDEDPTVVYVAKEEEKDFDDSEDEAELRRQARSIYGDQAVVTAPTSYGSSPYLQPNFAVLYLAIVAFVVLLVGNRRRRRKR